MFIKNQSLNNSRNGKVVEIIKKKLYMECSYNGKAIIKKNKNMKLMMYFL